MKSGILAICSQKGGVGKTATTQNLGHALAECGKRVLVVDLDPEHHLTTCSGYKANDLEFTLYDVIEATINLKDHLDTSKIILKTEYKADLAPANESLSGAEPDLYRESGGEFILKTCLESIRTNYDFVLLDCPPNLGLLTINALIAAEQVLIPVQADYLPMKAMQSTLKAITVVQRRVNLNPNLQIAGIFMTMTDRTKISEQVSEAIRNVFEGRLRVFDTEIRRRASIRYAQRENKSIFQYEPDGDVAKDYQNLAQELLKNGH